MSKATSSTKKGATAKSTKPSTHPSWIDMIKECIVAHPEDSRAGVSRPAIKKYIETKYKLAMDASHASLLSRSIISGSEKGTFVLPKGPAGKVKLAPKVRAEVVKETSKAEKENKKASKGDQSVPKADATTSKKTLATSAKQNKKGTATKGSGAKAVPGQKKPVEKAESSKKRNVRVAKKPIASTALSRKTAAKPATRKVSTKKSNAKKAAATTAASKLKKSRSKDKPRPKVPH